MKAKCPARRTGIHSLCMVNAVQRRLHIDKVQRKIKLAITKMGSEGTDMAIKVNYCIFSILSEGQMESRLLLFSFHSERFFGPKHAPHMLIKRNFSRSVWPSLPNFLCNRKLQYSSGIAVCKTAKMTIPCSCFVYILYRLLNNQLRSLPRKRKEAWMKKEAYHISISALINNAFVNRITVVYFVILLGTVGSIRY